MPCDKRRDHDRALPALLESSPTLARYLTSSPLQTQRLGECVGQALRGGEILALNGELGAGKTSFVIGLARGLQVPPGAVSSPTFVLIHEYEGSLPLVHVDLYRLGSPDLSQLGLEEYFDGRSVVAIEWAARASAQLPKDRMDIAFDHLPDSAERQIALVSRGPISATLLHRIIQSQRT